MEMTMRLIVCIFVFWAIEVTAAYTDIPISVVQKWATGIGESIQQIFVNATSIDRVQNSFQNAKGVIRKKDGDEMIREFATNVTEMLQQKHDALQRLVDVAEKSNAAHIFNESLTLDYPRAKRLPANFRLIPNERFDFTPVNTNHSSIHVPTDIYDQSPEVLNGVYWSNALDEVFRSNLENDSTIGWQYFSSAVGYFRIFPGMVWAVPPGGVDFFDSRIRPWYIQAATSPKDVVILVDNSGSMTGQTMTVARLTITAILDTLSDDDFFNVITFSEKANYVDDCFNDTLIQANADNKQRVKKRLLGIQTQGVARLEAGLIEAFAVLRRTDITREGAMCNKAIIVIGDEISRTFEEIFAQYNQPMKEVRVFIYLIGREVVDTNPSIFITCGNRGNFSTIATSADITENVQRYVQTMARPMVLSKPTIAVWTSAYLTSNDASEQELQMITTISQPVFDTRPEFNTSGILLGVIGTDVPVQTMTSLIPPYRLGVNGYSFAITNNGYIIFHPDFRPLDNGKPKPSYSSVDLAGVEISENTTELEKRMIMRETGNMTMKTTSHYDQMRKIAVRTNHYFFAPIGGTPFSLGIVLPDGYGSTWFDGRILLDTKTDLSTLSGDNVIIGSWSYCANMKTNGTESRLSVLLRILKDKRLRPKIDSLCNVELIEHLLFDADVTRQFVVWWKNNFESKNLTGIVRSIFVGTQSGLTRFWKEENQTYRINSSKSTSLSELYYSRAVDNGKDIITVLFQQYLNKTTTIYSVIMSNPVIVSDGNLSATVAVAGMQMNHDYLKSVFNSVTTCDSPGMNCTLGCHKSNLDCYLLDDSGFVVISKIESEIGRFFGEFESTLMLEIQDSVAGNDQVIYRSVVFHDSQDVCLLYSVSASKAPPTISTEALRHLLSFLLSFFSTFLSLVLQILHDLISMNWSVNSVLQHLMGPQSVAEAAESGPVTVPVMCDRPLNMLYTPSLSTTVDPSFYGSISNCPGRCKRTYAYSHIPRTNLFLVVAESTCTCSKDPPIFQEERSSTRYNDSTMCSRLTKNSFRMRPGDCFSSHPLEEDTFCRGNLFNSPSVIILLIVTALVHLVN